MTYIDKDKINRLCNTFEMNYKLTRLYAAYLEHCPELIKSDMVNLLCENSEITKEEAVIALVSQILGLDETKSEEDKKLIRNYIRPTVRILDAKKYTENKYYKNIHLANVKDGNWEIKTESYPPYRAMICGDMILSSDFTEIPPLAFFDEKFDFLAVLEDKNEWMTLTPVDIDTCEEAIEEAHGDVITFGLGLGYYAYMVSEKESVRKITVVERSPKVIELFKKHILPQFQNASKVEIIEHDAIEYIEKVLPSESYDYAFVDIWRDASDGAPIYKKIKTLEYLSPKTKFSYWIENFLISRLRAEKYEKMQFAIDMNLENAPKSYEEFRKNLTEVV